MKNKKLFLIILLIVLLIVISGWLWVSGKVQAQENIKSAHYVTTFQNNDIFIINPEKKEEEKYILYLHGGGYVTGITEKYWTFLTKFSNDTGYTIILPDYPLAPKYNYKDVFGMLEPLYKEIINKIGESKLIIMGDSAGGGMALALSELIGEESFKKPDKLILISPWLDTTMGNEKIDKVQKNDKLLNKYALKVAGELYSGEDGRNSYLVNPINGNLKNLPETIIFTGTYDILNPDVHILKERAEKEKIENIKIVEKEKAVHIWILQSEYCSQNDYLELIDSLE